MQRHSSSSLPPSITEVDHSLEEDQPLLKTSNSRQRQFSQGQHSNQEGPAEASIEEGQSRKSEEIGKEENSEQEELMASQQSFEDSKQEYFLFLRSRLKKGYQWSCKCTVPALNSVENRLQSRQLRINPVQRSIITNSTTGHNQKHQADMIRQLQLQKANTLRKLKEIEFEEGEILRNSRTKSMRPAQHSRSLFSEEDRKTVATLVRRKRQFQSSLELKTERFDEQVRKARRKEKADRERKFSQRNIARKPELEQHILNIKSRAQQRKEALSKSMIRQRKTYTHLKNLKILKGEEKERQAKLKLLLKEQQKKHQLDLNAIRQHEKKWQQRLVERAQYPSKRSISHPIPKRQPTHFSKLVDEELFQIKEKNYQTLMKVREHQFKNKIEKYQQKVHERYMPQIDPTKSIVVMPPISHTSLALSKQQRVEVGLGYLEKAKRLKKSASEPRVGTEVVIEKSEVGVGNSRYRDYFKEREHINYDPRKRELKEILGNKQELGNYQKVMRAKNLTESIGAKLRLGDDERSYLTAKAKLSLLKHLY